MRELAEYEKKKEIYKEKNTVYLPPVKFQRDEEASEGRGPLDENADERRENSMESNSNREKSTSPIRNDGGENEMVRFQSSGMIFIFFIVLFSRFFSHLFWGVSKVKKIKTAFSSVGQSKAWA